jgi:hypothetical protein
VPRKALNVPENPPKQTSRQVAFGRGKLLRRSRVKIAGVDAYGHRAHSSGL